MLFVSSLLTLTEEAHVPIAAPNSITEISQFVGKLNLLLLSNLYCDANNEERLECCRRRF